ncbi:MAG: hypothetical protein JXB60_05630 [Candidatus Cloacimonetes bacterium]|nr:hypothetical protein [Candidatus Cloacimonadota bacterium]
MNNRTLNRILAGTAVLLAMGYSFAQDIDEQLKDKYDSKHSFKRGVYQNTLQYIADNPQSPNIADLYFNLGEMSIEIDIDQPGRTLYYFQQVLLHDPDYSRKDVVLYNIGYYSFADVVNERDQGRLDNLDLAVNWPPDLRLTEEKLQIPIEAFSVIMNEHPQSDYYTESMYRLGILYFEIAMDSYEPQSFYGKAIAYFDRVANREADPLQHLGIFQRGWSYFSSGRFEEAITDFTRILEIIKEDSLTTKKAFFEADAIDNIAFSLIEYDGTNYDQASIAAQKAREIFRSFVSEQYAQEILLKAIELELTYSAPMRAVDLYNSYIWLYPLNAECPAFIDSIITIYKRYPQRIRGDASAEQLIVEQRIRLVNDYRTDSDWYQHNILHDVTSQLSIIREAYEFVEPRYFNDFVSNKNERNYFLYKNLVDNYGKYPSFLDEEGKERYLDMRIRCIDLSTNLAELSQNPAYYFYVIDNITAFNSDYPDHPSYFSYEEEKFYSSEKIYQLLIDQVQTAAYSDSLHDLYLDRNLLESFYIAATINYETMLQSPDYTNVYKEVELIRITQLRAELRYFRNELDDSFRDYSALLTYGIDDDLRTESYARLAEISRYREDYAQEESFYREAIKYALPEEKEAFYNNILASIQSGAEKKSRQGEHLNAASEYLRLAEELEGRDPKKSIAFRLKAIDSYQNAREYQEAIDQYLIIASKMDNRQDKFTAYRGAWSISDSLMGDWVQSERLRSRFIQQFPESNEAYRLRLQIISFYEDERFNDKLRAAEMYLELYDDAADMDIGTSKRENIYLNAIRIYRESGMIDKEIEHMLKFEKIYPEHSLANEFLQKVAIIYDERGETSKYEELARYIYRKDPSIDLLTPVVANKLARRSMEIDSLFTSGQYDLMEKKITEFRNIDQQYRNDGGKLDLSAFYDQFNYYQSYIDFHHRYEDYLSYVESEFLKSSPDQLIKVNELTQWKEHIIGDRRIEKLLERTDKIRDDVISMIQEGNNYELDTELRTHGLYLSARAYDYAGNAVEIQIQKFLDISLQLNSEQMQANPVQQQQYKDNLEVVGKKMAFDFKKKANEIYQSLLHTFYDDKGYSDTWTELAYDRLVEWGVRKPKIFMRYYTDDSWETAWQAVEITTAGDTALWQPASMLPEMIVLDSSAVIICQPGQDTFIRKNFQAEIKPELLKIDYISKQKAGILLNGVAIGNDTKAEPVAVGKLQALHRYQVVSGTDLLPGANVVTFYLQASEDNTGDDYFAARISLQFDQEALELHRATEVRHLLSDYTWRTQKVLSGAEEFIDAQDYQAAGTANFSFYISQMEGLETTSALPIWYPELDNTAPESVYFWKDFEIEAEVLSAEASYIGQDRISIWVNDIKFVDSEPIILDTKLNKVLARNLVIPNLGTGKNRILVQVEGGPEFKGFIFDMEYRLIKTAETEQYPEVEIMETGEPEQSEQ